MPTNFKIKNRPADIIYEIYAASITKCSVKFFADIYVIYSIKLNNIVSILQSTLNSSAASEPSTTVYRIFLRILTNLKK